MVPFPKPGIHPLQSTQMRISLPCSACIHTYVAMHTGSVNAGQTEETQPPKEASTHSTTHKRKQRNSHSVPRPPSLQPIAAYRPRLAPAYRPRSAPAYRPRLAPAYRPRLTPAYRPLLAPGVQPIGLGPGSSLSATVPSSLRTLYLSLSSGRLAAADLKERVRVQMDEKTPSKSDATNSVGQGRTVGCRQLVTGFFFTAYALRFILLGLGISYWAYAQRRPKPKAQPAARRAQPQPTARPAPCTLSHNTAQAHTLTQPPRARSNARSTTRSAPHRRATPSTTRVL